MQADAPSNFLMNEVAYNCAKGLAKLSIYQDDEVDPLKTCGYLAFWIRKLKPVEQCTSKFGVSVRGRFRSS